MKLLKRAAALILMMVLCLNLSIGNVLAASVDEIISDVDAVVNASDVTEDKEVKEQITEFADLSPIILTYDKRPELKDILADLPDKLLVYLDHTYTTAEIPVKWECEGSYEDTDYYYYQFNPVCVTEDYDVAEDIEMPYAGIFLSSDVGRASSMKGAVNSGTRGANETTIYKFLTGTMGLNKAAACGVLANIYSESAFSPTAWGDKGTSYGICQWHATRLTALKNYCNKNGYKYTSLTGQLNYMYYELKKSYNSSVLSYLKGVSNNAQGAYDAGYRWCLKYEIPANTKSVSNARGNLAKKTYWPAYKNASISTNTDSGTDKNPTTSANSAITISNATKPTQLTVGSPFILRGMVSSGNVLTSVTVGVYDSNGTPKITRTINPNKTTYDIHNIDNYITFGKLASGKYNYKVSAKTSSTSKTLVNQAFAVLKKSSISGTSSYTKTYGASAFNLNAKRTAGNGALSYTSSNNNVATVSSTGKVTIKGTGYCTITVKVASTSTYSAATKVVSIYVVPKKTSVSSLKAVGGRKLKVTWSKNSKATGYVIQYSTNKNFSSNVKSVTVTNYKTTARTLSSLTRNRKYYVRIRAYKKTVVNGQNKNLYASWSAIKTSTAIK
ncbi:MAG: phage tail tip lysozyme [Lachnospiraceae bacterium]|nr:phage tail tip lysozyme [Lachnospiraceae bacterium]